MSEAATSALPNLHEIPGLQTIHVRENLLLRPMEERDAPAIVALGEADPKIRKLVLVMAHLTTEEAVRQEVAKYKKDPGLIRYVPVENGEVVGLESLWRDEGFFGQPVRPYAYGFGYCLHPEARGQGIATASLEALERAVRSALRVDTVMAFCEDENPGSIAVLSRRGLTPTEEQYPDSTLGKTVRLYVKKVANDQTSPA